MSEFIRLSSAHGFPPVIDIEGLSFLIKRKPNVITIDRCRRPHTLPPACTPPDTKRPLWITEDVIWWLRQFEEQTVVVKPKMGAPNKAVRIAKRDSALAINNKTV